MELYDFLKHLNSGAPVYSDSEAFEYMHELSNEAMRITFRLNGSYHTPEEIRALFSQFLLSFSGSRRHRYRGRFANRPQRDARNAQSRHGAATAAVPLSGTDRNRP